MRLVTWNGFRGECRKRASLLFEPFRPDLVVLQECGAPNPEPDDQCLWFPIRPKHGVGVVARGQWRVERVPLNEKVPNSVYPVRVRGPMNFNLIAIWAQQEPTYVKALLHGLDHYREFLNDGPAIVAGDFNSHPRWDRKSSKFNHKSLEDLLLKDFSLVSGYHAAAERDGLSAEAPTYYHKRHEDKPFHIDYCFIPKK